MTIWLVIALFVWEVEFPEDIVGCAAVVFEVTLKVGLFAFIFQRYVAGEGPAMELTPLPEPRDVDWAELETLDSEHGEKADRASAGRFIKICCWFGYSVLIMVFTVECGGSFAARWARMVLKRCSSERGEREKRFYGGGKGERRRTAL